MQSRNTSSQAFHNEVVAVNVRPAFALFERGISNRGVELKLKIDRPAVESLRRRYKKLDKYRCELCGGSATERDYEEGLVYFRGQLHCADCLVPPLSEDELREFVYAMLNSSCMGFFVEELDQ